MDVTMIRAEIANCEQRIVQCVRERAAAEVAFMNNVIGGSAYSSITRLLDALLERTEEEIDFYKAALEDSDSAFAS